MSGLCSSIAAMNFSGGTCTPRSMTSKPAPSSMMLTRFLPMSCTSPLTVPITNLPTVSAPVSASSGRSRSSAPDIALPAISISGTKKSPRSKRAPTSSSEGISASNSIRSGRETGRKTLVRQIEHRGRVSDQRLVVQALEDLVVVHAAPSSRCRYPRRAESASASTTSSVPSRSRLRCCSLIEGPEMASAAITCARALAHAGGDREQAGLELLDARRVAALAHERELALQGLAVDDRAPAWPPRAWPAIGATPAARKTLPSAEACSTSCRPTQFVAPRM